MEFFPDRNLEVLSVSQLTSRIRKTVSGLFRDVYVEGEISNQKLYPSGHFYFTLKDDAAMIRGVFFNYAQRYPAQVLDEGVAVICRGRVDVYEKRGEYQFIVESLDVKGLGLLQLKFRMLKEKLFKEGLFDEKRKKAPPFLPHNVGIITSPVGAAVRDMLKVIFRKFENMCVTIYPVKVQGEEAPGEIVEALDYFNRTGEVDVIILGRGGGSLEDLAAFNEEVVGRAVAASRIPVVSGIGHEIDYTIADFVADVRTPTPTAAAEFVVKNKAELAAALAETEKKLCGALRSMLEGARLNLYAHSMALREKKDFFTSCRMYNDELASDLAHGFSVFLNGRRQSVNALSQRLLDLNPENILRRGYSITTRKTSGEVVDSAAEVAIDEELVIRLHRGFLDVTVKNREKG